MLKDKIKSDIWTVAIDRLATELNQSVVSRWFSKIELLSQENGKIVLSTSSRTVREWVLDNYFHKLREVLISIDSGVTAVEIVLSQIPASTQNNNSKISSNVDPSYVFEKFVVGNSNKFAFLTCKEIADNCKSSNVPSISYIYSDVGMGKTHLLQAVYNKIQNFDKAHKAVYLSADKFMYFYMTAVRENDVIGFRHTLRKCDVLLIDDIQFVFGKKSTQTELISLIDDLFLQGKKVIVSGERKLNEFQNIDERVKSRLISGLLVRMEAPDITLKKEIVTTKLKQTKVLFDENIVDYIAASNSGSIREIEGMISQIVTRHSLLKLNVTKNDIEEVIGDYNEKKEENKKVLSLKDLVSIVSKECGVSKQEISSSSRITKLVFARQMIAYIAKKYTKSSLAEIGGFIGNKTHATVIYYVNTFAGKISSDNTFNSQYKNIISLIEEKIK